MTSLSSELSELIPLALIIALSPLSIIPAVLVLHTPRPRPTGLAFLAGWLFGLTALVAIFVGVSGLLGGVGKSPAWASWLRIVVGAALIVFGIFRWLRRHSNPHQPAWLRQITEVGPGKALAAGAVLTVVNPKVLFVCAAAGLAVGTAGLASHDVMVAVILFVAVSASTVALPIVAYTVSGDRLDPPLARLKAWMEKHNAAMVAIILIVIGILVLYKGIHGL
ncbi:MAG: GAP family protein [Actinobacteria bacterium]|nr:GAP family protein [Actinomycetota bacterium]